MKPCHDPKCPPFPLLLAPNPQLKASSSVQPPLRPNGGPRQTDVLPPKVESGNIKSSNHMHAPAQPIAAHCTPRERMKDEQLGRVLSWQLSPSVRLWEPLGIRLGLRWKGTPITALQFQDPVPQCQDTTDETHSGSSNLAWVGFRLRGGGGGGRYSRGGGGSIQ